MAWPFNEPEDAVTQEEVQLLRVDELCNEQNGLPHPLQSWEIYLNVFFMSKSDQSRQHNWIKTNRPQMHSMKLNAKLVQELNLSRISSLFIIGV